MALATWLKEVADLSGLRYVELEGWRTRQSPGGEAFRGVLVHHTGSYDGIADATNDLSYAKWMALTGRSDLPAPLCNLALSAEGVVYLCAAGNANHAGSVKASGPLPAAGEGNALYIGIEAMNSGSQGWTTKGTDRSGKTITQYQAYVRLCAALCKRNGWPSSHVRAHKETSYSGKWDPGGIDMNDFRADVAGEIKRMGAPSTKPMDPAAYFRGAEGEHVLWYKARLEAHGYDKGVDLDSNRYGRGAIEATKRFQLAQGWSGKGADGFPGPETLKRLKAMPPKAEVVAP